MTSNLRGNLDIHLDSDTNRVKLIRTIHDTNKFKMKGKVPDKKSGLAAQLESELHKVSSND